jgi:hypothetical protein
MKLDAAKFEDEYNLSWLWAVRSARAPPGRAVYLARKARACVSSGRLVSAVSASEASCA